MDTLLLGLQVLLAAVFATAAVGKLLDLPGSRQALSDFGVPQRLVPVAGVALPLAELGVAIALIPQPSARWGALGALALLLTFLAGIANALRRGEAPDCHCFGQIQSAPAGPETLVRNGVLSLRFYLDHEGEGPRRGDGTSRAHRNQPSVRALPSLRCGPVPHQDGRAVRAAHHHALPLAS